MERLYSFIALHKGLVARYTFVGILNVAVTIAMFNLLIFFSGVTRGPLIPVFSIITSAVAIVHSFIWNKLWVFKHKEGQTPWQFVSFAVVATITALVSSGIIHLLVNIVGAPAFIAPALWVNIAIVVTIPVTFLCNFFGIKFFVFKTRGKN